MCVKAKKKLASHLNRAVVFKAFITCPKNIAIDYNDYCQPICLLILNDVPKCIVIHFFFFFCLKH